ncbi:MAG: hypothetical protein GTO03_00415, partial [Planctomycetales bacterium]|nr:hypothetical protein [Planctomycetales bacterium]
HWEYDLDQGTGQLIVHNLSVPLDLPDEWLYLVGLVPANVDAQYDPSVVDLNPCTSAVVPPLPYLFAKLPPGT